MRAIALLTDFGTRDPYVAAMKGVLASRTSVPLHDLSHEIPPYDILAAAWFLRTVADYWPAGTVFVCVVDPGVGTSRRIVAMERDGRVFLAPDNGLLTFVFARNGQAGLPLLHDVVREELFLPRGSNTFHGRDRFAPVAAALANGLTIAEVGPRIDSIVTLPYTPPAYGEVVRGSIVAVDRFGNAITDVELERIPFESFALTVRGNTIDRLERNYGDAAPGPFLIAGSSGCLEISIANASAAERLHLRPLDRVAIIAS